MHVTKSTERMVLEASVCYPRELLNKALDLSEIIKHLQEYESEIVSFNPEKMEMLDLSIKGLHRLNDEDIRPQYYLSHFGKEVLIRTFSEPYCRYVKIHLTDKLQINQLGRIRKAHYGAFDKGFDLRPVGGAHAALTIKLERMHDNLCYASWNMVSK